MDEINEIVEVAKDTATNNEDISHLRDIIENDTETTNLDSEKASFRIRQDGTPDYTNQVSSNLKEADIGLDEIDKLEEINNSKINKDSVKESAFGFDLNDEEAENIAKIVIMYKNNHSLNVFSEMIPSLRHRINSICLESNIPLSESRNVAKYMIEQFISNASEDEEFVDIEKSLEKAMKMPSIIDLYTEHINETMNVRLPIMADEIRKTDPDKADMLMKVCDEYNNAFLFSRLRDMYDNQAAIRKAVRKNYKIENIAKLAKEVNYFNSKTQFKMPDCSSLLGILSKVFEHDTELYPSDICKFTTLLLSSISWIDFGNIADTSYMYYLLKNISMLSYLGDKKSDFSAELISNIRITIFYIRIREDELNERNSSMQQRSNSNNAKHKGN